MPTSLPAGQASADFLALLGCWLLAAGACRRGFLRMECSSRDVWVFTSKKCKVSTEPVWRELISFLRAAHLHLVKFSFLLFLKKKKTLYKHCAIMRNRKKISSFKPTTQAQQFVHPVPDFVYIFLFIVIIIKIDDNIYGLFSVIFSYVI